MKPRKIILVRHAESISNVDHSIHATIPDYKIELTENGARQALDAGLKIKEILDKTLPDIRGGKPQYLWSTRPEVAVYSSPFCRTRETYSLIKSSISNYVRQEYEDPRLREQEYGHLRGIEEANKIEVAREAYGKFYFRIPDGENGGQVFDRQKGFLDTLYRDFQKQDFPDNVLIIGHGFQIRILLMAWLHWTVEEFESKRNLQNCEIVELVLDNDKYRLLKEFV